MSKTLAWSLAGGLLFCGLGLPVVAQNAKAAAKPAAKAVAKEVSVTQVSATEVALPVVATDKSARVILLDKQTNRRQVLVLTSGEAQTVGSVVVTLTKCMPDYAGVLGQDVAWLDVNEGAEGSGRNSPWFSGWMFNTYPEISTLDHPRYDVQLQGCGVKVRQVIKASGSAPVLDSAPVGDTETPGDTPIAPEAPAGAAGSSDPYYVPGVIDKNEPVPTAPVVEAPAVEAPAADTEAPAAAEPASEPAAEGQVDLHKMMDGTY